MVDSLVYPLISYKDHRLVLPHIPRERLNKTAITNSIFPKPHIPSPFMERGQGEKSINQTFTRRATRTALP